MQAMCIDYLYKKYFSRLMHFAYNIINDYDAAKDIVQDSFINYIKNNYKLENEAVIFSIFKTSVKHKCLDYLKAKKAHGKYVKATIQTEVDLIAEVNLKEVEFDVLDFINLSIEYISPPKTKAIFKAWYIEQLNHNEIALKFKIKKQTVHNAIQQAKDQLRFIFHRNYNRI